MSDFSGNGMLATGLCKKVKGNAKLFEEYGFCYAFHKSRFQIKLEIISLFIDITIARSVDPAKMTIKILLMP